MRNMLCLGGAIFLFSAVSSAMTEDDPSPLYQELRKKMVAEQIASRGVKTSGVLDALNRVPRHEFVPDPLKKSAYTDGPLPLGHGQTISQPYIVAFMTELLELRESDKVLEIGTGSGYQAAVLAEMVKDVYTIEIVEELYAEAKERLSRLGYRNVRTKLGNGWLGWPEEAPFDKILVTAAPDEIPQALVAQLKEGGLLVVPVGKQHQVQDLIVGVKRGQFLEQIKTIPVRFVPLVEKAGA